MRMGAVGAEREGGMEEREGKRDMQHIQNHEKGHANIHSTHGTEANSFVPFARSLSFRPHARQRHAHRHPTHSTHAHRFSPFAYSFAHSNTYALCTNCHSPCGHVTAEKANAKTLGMYMAQTARRMLLRFSSVYVQGLRCFRMWAHRVA